MSDAREAILARVRAALADVPRDEAAAWDPSTDDDPATAYRRSADGDRAGAVALLARRIDEYRAEVTRVAQDDEVAGLVTGLLARHDARRIAVPAGLPRAWLPHGPERLADDPPLDHDTLAAVDGVLTGCRLAIAATGTIVLDGGPLSGRRALTLLPDLHVCVVHAAQVVGSVPEAVAALDPALRERLPLTFVSGPSATSDIELDRVEGVHGPRRLHVVLVG